MDPFAGLNLNSSHYNQQQQQQQPGPPFDGSSQLGTAQWPQQNGGGRHLETGLSTDDLAWLEQQLSLAASQPQQPPPIPPTSAPLPSLGASYSPNVNNFSQPTPNPAFPPISNSRFHPYQLPGERATQRLRPGSGGGGGNVGGGGGHLLSPHLQQLQQQYLAQQQAQQQQQNHLPPQRPPLGQSTSSTGPFDWPSFGTVASSFAPVPPPQHPPHLSQAPSYPSPAPYAPIYPSPLASQLPVPPHAAQTPRPTVLYPPHDAPSPLLLPDEPSPILPLAPHASPASAISSIPTPRPVSPSSGSPRDPRPRHRRARSEPPPLKEVFFPPAEAGTSPGKKSGRVAGLPAPQATKAREQRKKEQLDSLFGWLDSQRWSFSNLFTALSDIDPGSSTSAAERVEAEHKRRLEEFLQLDGDGGGLDEGARAVREARRRWALRKGELEGEKGPDEVVRMWEEMGGLGRSREGHMANAVRELHSNVHDGAVAGVSIRRIINRYGEAYNESASDIKRLDAALALPPSPHLTSVPREAAVWTGMLVIPPTQAELVQGWLTAPGRPEIASERGKIEAEHMRIYSSLSPLDLHARGAELCRVILLRDVDAMRQHGHNFDRLHLFTRGPTLAPLDTCGFAQYDDYSLFHHAVMVYLQLCVRYPGFREGKEATIHILPDLPPPVHPTPLETLLIDRALHSHWDNLRLFLLDSHGGLLRSAVRAFAGVKLSKVDLLSVCDDTWAVIEALKKNKKNSNDRILRYDPAISQVRNVWRQRAFYDETADLVAWSAATTHFLELSALFPEFGLGVRDLPGLESLLGQASSSSANSTGTPGSAQNSGPSPMSH